MQPSCTAAIVASALHAYPAFAAKYPHDVLDNEIPALTAWAHGCANPALKDGACTQDHR